MKSFNLFLIVLLFFVPVFAQKPKPTPRKPSAAKPKPIAANEKEEFEKAASLTDLNEKIAALQKFAADFPKSLEKTHALELIVSSRAQLGDQKLQAGETAPGIELFKLAVTDAPTPMSDKLFTEVVLQFPTNLFYRGQQDAAVEITKSIEEKIGANAKQILGLATFFIGTENADEARRLAEKAISIDPQLPVAYQTLGLANRLNFQLDDSVAAYTKALELDPNSIVSKRSLAEMKRALGKPADAAVLYRELVEKNADDVAAQTGLILSLFDDEKQPEAETQMSQALEKNANNVILMVGAAYWYAAHKDAAKAIDLAQRAIAIEPRYTWARIALARGFLLQNQFTDAEKQLLLARQYGNFPTLTYELASVRLAAGFYEEAAQELKKSFAVTDGAIQTRLGNRALKEEKSFIGLLEAERRASIFEPLAADSPENADKLKALLSLDQNLSSAEIKDEEIEKAVNEFVDGDDKAKTHRQLYAANRLLQAKKDLPKVLELTQASVSGLDSALEIPSAPSATLADELLASRTLAISRGEVVVVPDISRQTLSAILRGRIEEIAGWALFNQNKPIEAVVRLKRAVSVLPEKSAWWRSSIWHLGAALDAAGNPPEALKVYVKGYVNSPPDAVKYSIIEAVYQKVHGNTEGLEKEIGERPAESTFAAVLPQRTSANTEAKTEASPTPELKVEPTPEAAPTPAPVVSPTPEASPKVETTTEPSPTPTPEASASPKIEATPTPAPTPEISPSPTPEITPAKVEASPTPENKTEVKTESLPTPSPTPEQKVPVESATPETAVKPSPSPTPLFDPIVITVPKPQSSLKISKTETAKVEQKPETTNSEKPQDSTPVDGSGEVRPRVTKTQSTESSTSENSPCNLAISQENITLIANGGNLGVLVGFQGEGDISKITALSSSPADIDISLDPDIGKESNRAFFIIKSISPKTGIFTVTFDSACGKKQLQVKVR